MIDLDIKNNIYKNVVCNIKTKCWEWTGFINKNGYGVISLNKKSKRAHRISYEVFVGKLIKNMQVNHICNNRSCINPSHLEQITHAKNGSRERANHYNSRKKFCKRGHEFNQENTTFTVRPYGHDGWVLRTCKICLKITYERRKLGLSTKRVTLEKRFMEKVSVSTDGCWEWMASKNLGYGKFKYKKEMRLAHRVSYKIFKGDFDENLVIDHICYNRGCVNPEHLQPLTREQNSQRGGVDRKKVDN